MHKVIRKCGRMDEREVSTMTPKVQNLPSILQKRQQQHKVLLNELVQLDKQLTELEARTKSTKSVGRSAN